MLTPWTVASKTPLSMAFSPRKNTGVGEKEKKEKKNTGVGEKKKKRILEWVAIPFSREPP